MSKNIIAIDGPAASGKGTLSRNLAKALNFAHMDTGALYRAVGFEVLSAGGNPDDEADSVHGAKNLALKLGSGEVSAILGNPRLREEATGNAASRVASIQSVRDMLVDIQRSFARNPPAPYRGAILDGRDIGTVICPDAPLKLYVTAGVEIRAQRRLKELQSKGLDVMYEAVLEDMRVRDERDSGRKAAPLRPAEDAVVIDSSDLTEGQMLEMALDYARQALSVASS